MLMADTMAIFFVVLGLLLAFPGLWLLCRGLWPQTVAKASLICNQGLVKPFLVGLPVTVATIFVAAVLGNLGPAGKISAAVVVCLYLVLAHCGVSGLAGMIGQRLYAEAEPEQPWRTTLRGGLVLELTYLLPILGWFGTLPISTTIGCGAFLLALLTRFASPSFAPASEAERAEAAEFGATGAIGAKQ